MNTYKFTVTLQNGTNFVVATHGSTMPQAKKKVINIYKFLGDEAVVSLYKGTQEPVSVI